MSTARPRWTSRGFYILLLLFVIAISVGQKTKEEITQATPESSSEKTDAEGQLDQPPQISWWGKLVLPPRVQGLLTPAIVRLAMLAVVVFHLLRWPLLLALFIMLQCFFHEEINPGVTVPWESIATKSTLHLAIWTIIGVGLLLKPNRIQGLLWKFICWTHAVNWWLFWVPFETYSCGTIVARWFGTPCSQNTWKVVFFVLRPSLVAYLYSGVVRDVLFAVRLGKYFWNNDVMNIING